MHLRHRKHFRPFEVSTPEPLAARSCHQCSPIVGDQPETDRMLSKSQQPIVRSRNRAILGWIPRRVVSAYDVVNASYLPTTITIYDLEIRSINNYRKSYDIASFLVSTKISRICRFGNSKPCKYIRSSYVRRNCIYDNDTGICKHFLLRLSLISLVNGQHSTTSGTRKVGISS